MALCCFFAERWADWSHDGRPLVADEYKRYLGQAVLMARIVGNRTYDEVRSLVGSRGGYFLPNP